MGSERTRAEAYSAGGIRVPRVKIRLGSQKRLSRVKRKHRIRVRKATKGCPVCYGSGGKKRAPCQVCHGTGRVPR